MYNIKGSWYNQLYSGIIWLISMHNDDGYAQAWLAVEAVNLFEVQLSSMEPGGWWAVQCRQTNAENVWEISEVDRCERFCAARVGAALIDNTMQQHSGRTDNFDCYLLTRKDVVFSPHVLTSYIRSHVTWCAIFLIHGCEDAWKCCLHSTHHFEDYVGHISVVFFF